MSQMKNRKNTKMRLSRETLRTLTTKEAALVAGGIAAGPTSSNDPTSC